MFSQTGVQKRGCTACVLLLQVMYARSYERSRFEKEVTFNDLLLFEEFTLGPPSDKSKDECAQDCHRNQSCTAFSISLVANACQLYGDVVYPDVATAQGLPGRSYYVYSNDRCPGQNEFTFLRGSNLCIRMPDIELDYDGAVGYCADLGGTLIVLEEEDKATAVVELIQRIGDDSTFLFLGARVQGNDPKFVWIDGQPLTRNWWGYLEPNNHGGDENCLGLFQNGMNDIGCTKGIRFICEIPQEGSIMGRQSLG